MAADGGWPNALDEPDDGGARRAVGQLRAILGDVERRLATRTAPLPPQAEAALVAALEALSQRLRLHEDATAGRYASLTAALAGLAVRLEAQAEHEARLERRLGRVEAGLAAVRRASEPRAIRLVFMVASLAAALSVLGAGAVIVANPEALPRAVTASQGDLKLRRSLRTEPPPPPGLRAVLPRPVAPAAPAAEAVRERYEAVAAALERGEATALSRMTGLALAGDARAQLHVAGLYEVGAPGVSRDLAAARLWTRRAAQGGDRVAMHNLALFLMAGEGGPRDHAEAAGWFRRAAERGVVDSQYNLGLLYEAGRGVGKNLREAYRWFAVAANAGDAAAREKQVEVEARLTSAERAGLDRDVAGYRPGAAEPGDLAVVIPPATSLAETQALLARKGYYVGPVDGVTSPALRSAAAAYLRDNPGAARRP